MFVEQYRRGGILSCPYAYMFRLFQRILSAQPYFGINNPSLIKLSAEPFPFQSEALLLHLKTRKLYTYANNNCNRNIPAFPDNYSVGIPQMENIAENRHRDTGLRRGHNNEPNGIRNF